MKALLPQTKHFFFRHYWWLIGLFGLIAIAYLYNESAEPDWPLCVTVAGAIVSAIYFVQKQRLQEMRLFKEIFVECNARYDSLNESLNKITLGASATPLTDEEKNALYDYFNLCGEEYLYYREGYILPSVWNAWRNGIRSYLNEPRIRELWDTERQSDSYYGLQV